MNQGIFFEFNKLSQLHNNSNIFFCKTDYIVEEFNRLSNNQNTDIILLTGNSDYAITDDVVKLAPPNISVWYATNAVSNSDLIIPLPLGLENKLPSIRPNHGIGYFDRASHKERLLNISNSDRSIPGKLIYANFNINTNYQYRSTIKNYCINSNHIDWEEPNLTLDNLFNKILEYKMIVCPAGNGIDTHRLWEVLYSNRVPITIKTGNYKIYELYKKLPIIILDNISDLLNYNLILEKYYHIKSQSYDLSLLNINYWISLILKSANNE
jgi:hypothetical protein